MKRFIVLAFLISFFIFLSSSASGEKKNSKVEIQAVKIPPAEGSNSYYVSNRPPLLGSPLIKLPIGSIQPKGWLLSQLQMMRDGFTGRLPELSKFLKSESGWLDFKSRGWEEVPYWLKGYGDLGYVLKDPKIIDAAKKCSSPCRAFMKQQGMNASFLS